MLSGNVRTLTNPPALLQFIYFERIRHNELYGKMTMKLVAE